MRPSGKQVQTENRSRTGQTALSETDQEPQGPTVGKDRYWEILKMIPGMTPVKSVLKPFDAGQRIIHTVTCNTPKHTRAHTHTPCSRGLKRRKTDCSIQHLILHADKDRNCPLCVSPTPSVCVTHSFLFHNSFSIQISFQWSHNNRKRREKKIERTGITTSPLPQSVLHVHTHTHMHTHKQTCSQLHSSAHTHKIQTS